MQRLQRLSTSFRIMVDVVIKRDEQGSLGMSIAYSQLGNLFCDPGPLGVVW